MSLPVALVGGTNARITADPYSCLQFTEEVLRASRPSGRHRAYIPAGKRRGGGFAARTENARDMTAADITLAAFTLCNSIRVVAYVPQIAKAATDREGAQAISFTTWGLFLCSNASAVAYALVNQGDWTMAAMFLGNAFGCSAILLIGAWKRSRCRNRQID